ncbi:MAG TPA: SRPBCC family protein [Verrucomicrobiae bacterium]|nr:SRPBCC family protein [Verrucomicrobiae bacterium]
MKWVKRIVMVVAALLILPVLTLLLLGLRSGAGHVRSSVDVQASPGQLWTWIDDGEYVKRWVSWTVEMKPWNPSAGVGATRSAVMRDENNGGAQMVIDGTCTEYTPPKMLAVKLSVPNVFDGLQTYHLTDLGNGRTRLVIEMSYHFDSALARLMEPLITPSARKKMDGDLARLKSLVEGRAELH